MSQFERILQRQPQIDEAEVEDVRARAIARLLTFSLPREELGEAYGATVGDVEMIDDGPDVVIDRTEEHDVVLSALEPDIEPPPVAHDIDIQVVDHAEPISLPLAGPWAVAAAAEAAGPARPPIIALGAPPPDDEPTIAHITILPPAEASVPSAPAPESAPPVAEAPVAEAPVSLAPAPAAPAKPRPAKRAPRTRVLATAYCPYCALRLDPPPTEDQRCTRCRQQIVVREVDGGMLVLLTQGAIKVFDAERERAANIERWGVERRTWLDLARWVGAPAHRIERLERPVASLESVRAARAFYDATVDSAVEGALRHDLWDVAAVYRREQADSIRGVSGADLPPSDEVRELYRVASTLELRGIASMARTATIVGARCCETCRAANGTVHKVAVELRSSTLPHAACPTGLCRCRWDLTPHDVRMIQRYLERTRGLPGEAKGEVESSEPVSEAVATPG